MENTMDSKEFLKARKSLNRTQKQLSELLGTSIKAIHSYEQGWRKVPGHIERQIFFLLSRNGGKDVKKPQSCWTVKKCPSERKKQCPAWELQAGKLCWFINGTICEGKVQKNWEEKMKICRECEVLSSLL
jgi:DNA-binding XRE family transcriptional regulator